MDISPAPRPVLELRDIVKTYGGVHALDTVSFTLLPGEVHCLAGENGSGKSTLIKIISGVETPDSGVIVVGGERHASMTPASAIAAGVQVIYQDFSLFPNLSVAENIAMPRQRAVGGRFYSARAARPIAQGIIDELGLALDLDADVAALSVADKQLTAICRALVSDAQIIIMDEPTTALTGAEVTALFALVRRLQSRGVSLIFVSHKLDEVLRVSQRLTVLRNGTWVATGAAGDYDRDAIAGLMTGKDIDTSRVVSAVPADAAIALEVKGLGRPGAFADVDLVVRCGEIVGLTGLLGSGRGEIAEAIFGVRPATTGTIAVGGHPVRIQSIPDAVAAGIGYVPEDRLTQGLFLDDSIADNVVAASVTAFAGRARLLDRARMLAFIQSVASRLRIKAPNLSLAVRSLSGGNAQRVVLAKWLMTNPKVLLLNGPTVGVDVGSKSEILEILRTQASAGMGVVVISDDIPELYSACHRVLIVQGGRIVCELAGDAVRVETIEQRIAA